MGKLDYDDGPSRCHSVVGWVYPCLALMCLIAVCIFANRDAYPTYIHASDNEIQQTPVTSPYDELDKPAIDMMTTLSPYNGSTLSVANWKNLATAPLFTSVKQQQSNDDILAPYLLRLFPTVEQLHWMEATLPTEKAALFAQEMHGEVIEESGRRQYNLEIRLRGMSSLNIEHCGPGRSFDISVVQNGKKSRRPQLRYAWNNLCNDNTRLAYRSAVRLLKKFNLFTANARFAELGVVHPVTGQYQSYGVYLLTEHPFDALHLKLPGDAQIFMKTRKNQLRAEYPLSIMGAIEAEQSAAQREGKKLDVQISIPKQLYPMPTLAQVDQAQLFAFYTVTSVLMNGGHTDETMFYTNITEKGQKTWGVNAWDLESIGTHCPARDMKFAHGSTNMFVPHALLYCAGSPLDWEVMGNIDVEKAFVEFFARETGPDGGLSFDDIQVAFAQSRAEYERYRIYDKTSELEQLSEILALRHALLRTLLADIVPNLST